MLRPVLVCTLLALAAAAPAGAQESASYRLEESVLNSGGHPRDGAVLASGSYRLTLGALGQGVRPGQASAASFLLQGGFGGAYPPPGEVMNVRFTSADALAWDPEPSVGVYNLYQGSLGAPFDTGYGTCAQQGLTSPGATVSTVPAAGSGLFVLVTAENLLAEEGTKGANSAGSGRGNPAPCP